jgi:hypothetical protein
MDNKEKPLTQLFKAEYRTWSSMKVRCYNQNDAGYKNYGGRGIKICDRWRYSFKSFLDDMGPRPSPEHSIDRINVNGNYEPLNCRWADPIQQASNKRSTILIEYQGQKKTLPEWCRHFGLKEERTYNRYATQKLPLDEVFASPKNHSLGFIRARSEGRKHPIQKLTEPEVIHIRALHEQGHSAPQIAKIYNCSPSNINLIIRRKIWTHL